MFDSYLKDETVLAAKRRRQRARNMAIAAAVYAVGLTVTIVYEYTQVEALPAPTVPVILMAAPPPPPPPPPPPGGHHSSATVVHKTVSPNVLLQPLDKPIPKQTVQQNNNANDDPNGVEGGVEGGQAGGVLGGQIGGVLGGVLGGTVGGMPGGLADQSQVQQMKSVTPEEADAHRLCCDPHISRPAAAVSSHIFGSTTVTVCVDAYGNISQVTPLTSLQFITDKIVEVIKSTWKYKPFMINGKPTPSCFVEGFEYQEE